MIARSIKFSKVLLLSFGKGYIHQILAAELAADTK